MEHRVEMWKTVRLILILAAFIGAGWGVVHLVEKAVNTASSGMQRGLSEVLEAITHSSTRVVEGRAEIVESTEISELALMEMKMSATRTIEKSDSYAFLPLGTKKLIVRGYYRVKGGYRLKKGVSLGMEDGKPVARFPKPEVLSVELIDYDILSEDSGWMNKIQPGDRAQILRELRQQMQVEAEESGMLSTVESTLRTRLRDLLGTGEVNIEEEIP